MFSGQVLRIIGIEVVGRKQFAMKNQSMHLLRIPTKSRVKQKAYPALLSRSCMTSQQRIFFNG
jgi:hypothetical protein